MLVNRHETSEHEKFEVDEFDKNVDNPDAKLYSILSVGSQNLFYKINCKTSRHSKRTEMKKENCISFYGTRK